MTASITTSRPYSPYLVIPYLPTSTLLRYILKLGCVDNGLSDAERAALVSSKRRRSVTALTFLQWMITFGALLAIPSIALVASPAEFPIGLVMAAVTVAMLTAGINAEVRLRREKKNQDQLIDELESRGVLARPRENSVHADLKRVRLVLDEMHRRGDTSLDDQARGAVDKIVRQNVQRPTEKQKAIAESTASDSASITLRMEATARSARWSADVAEAELALRGLEEAAAEALRK